VTTPSNGRDTAGAYTTAGASSFWLLARLPRREPLRLPGVDPRDPGREPGREAPEAVDPRDGRCGLRDAFGDPRVDGRLDAAAADAAAAAVSPREDDDCLLRPRLGPRSVSDPLPAVARRSVDGDRDTARVLGARAIFAPGPAPSLSEPDVAPRPGAVREACRTSPRAGGGGSAASPPRLGRRRVAASVDVDGPARLTPSGADVARPSAARF